jgi:acetyl-CoA C-acetyltransferase
MAGTIRKVAVVGTAQTRYRRNEEQNFPAMIHEYGVDKKALAKVAVKNHYNGKHHPKAHIRKEVTEDQVLNAPIISSPLGLFDCCPTTDGAAAVVLTRPELAKKFTDSYALVKGLGLAVETGEPFLKPGFPYIGWPATEKSAAQAYEQAGIEDPKKEIDFAEVHDCFTITEILNIEDLGFAEKGEGWKYLEDGKANVEGGEVAINPSGGLKSFGHPIGATGCRMIAEVTSQLLGRAEGLQVKDAKIGLAHNLGGSGAVCSVAILGLQ